MNPRIVLLAICIAMNVALAVTIARQRTPPAQPVRQEERSKRYQELQKEKSALLVELLGVDVEKQRQGALNDIQAETEKAVKTALGDNAYEKYQMNGGWWLKNISPVRRLPANEAVK